MLCKKLSLFPRWPLRPGAVAILGLLIGAAPAFADRIVYFEALGHNEIVSGGKKFGYYDTSNGNSELPSSLKAKCKITVTNSSPNSQKINMSVTGTAKGTSTSPITGIVTDIGTTITPAVITARDGNNSNIAWPLTNYALPANAQIVVQVEFAPPNYLGVATQDTRCSGSISVKDDVVTSPGFVVANGMMVTWSQGTSAYQAVGTGQLRAEVRYYYNPFTIGGGRAF